MSSKIGMDAGLVRQAAASIDRLAGELDRMVGRTDGLVAEILGHWDGSDAAAFHQAWVSRHRSDLVGLGAALHGYAQVAAANASAQDQTSASSTGATAGTTRPGGGIDWSSIINGASVGGGLLLTLMDSVPKDVGRYSKTWKSVISETTKVYRQALEHAPRAFQDTFKNLPDDVLRYKKWGIVHDLNDLHGFVHIAGRAAGVIGLGFTAVSVGEDLRNGDVDGAATDVATQLKGTPTPVSYLGGVAIQSWVQASKAAENVDWSPQGMSEIADAGPREWADAFGESFKEMPGQLYKIFKFW